MSYVDISYDAMFHIYASPRVFDDDHDSCASRLSLVLGFQLSTPASELFVGLGYEIVPGATFVVGIQPRKVPRLRPGVVIGTSNADSTIPTDTTWSAAYGGVGISFDTNVARSIVAAFSLK